MALMCLVVLGLATVTLSVRADEERIPVYMQVPADWEGPCVWAWDDDGKGAFDAWPGGEADADPANEGWYYCWIPAWANHVIVNGNAGTVQTEEILLDGSAAWITVAEDASFEVSTEALTEGDAPEYVEKFAIHAKVDDSWENPGLWAWSAPDGTNAFEAWPGKAMTAGENGWYTAKAPVWVNSIIINANEGSVQTSDLTIDPAEIWVTVNADGEAEFSYVDPDKASLPDVTIHVSAPADWEAPCLWAWSAPDGTNVFASWPGEALEADESGWLVKTIPGWVNSVIVNGNEGSVQTTDISVETGKDIWLVVTGPEEYEVSYEEIALPEGSASTAESVAEETTAATEAAAETTVAEETVAQADEKSGTNPVPFAVGGVAVLAAAGAGIAAYRKKKSA